MQKGEIKQEFTQNEFKQLTMNELMKMGLRSLNPFDFHSEANVKKKVSKIIIKDFLFSYKKHSQPQLDIPQMELPQNEIIGIIGNNGAGKSTFARCLCGLHKSSKGTLEVGTKRYNTKQQLRRAYMVMQDVNHQPFTESVLDKILLSMDGDNIEKDTMMAKEILHSLDLIEIQELHPISLSGGEKQRVAIGSAITSQKEIIILDEPTSWLDYRHMLEVSKNLERLQEMGKSIFIITHDPAFLYSCCTYIMCMNNGQVEWAEPINDQYVEKMYQFFDKK